MVTREIITEPFERVCVDLVGPLPKARGGYQYLLTYVCVATRWPEAVPLRSMHARAVLDALMDIFARNWIPQIIISDNGAQLTGKMMTEFCSMYGIQKIETAPYRPQSNGLVERFHGTLIPLLKKCSNNKSDWVKLLPMPYDLLPIPLQESPHMPLSTAGNCTARWISYIAAGWNRG